VLFSLNLSAVSIKQAQNKSPVSGHSHKSRRSSIHLQRRIYLKGSVSLAAVSLSGTSQSSFVELCGRQAHEDTRKIVTLTRNLVDRIRFSFQTIPSIKSISLVNDALKLSRSRGRLLYPSGLIREVRLDFSLLSLSSFSQGIVLHLILSSRLHVPGKREIRKSQFKRTIKWTITNAVDSRCAVKDAPLEMFIKRR